MEHQVSPQDFGIGPGHIVEGGRDGVEKHAGVLGAKRRGCFLGTARHVSDGRAVFHLECRQHNSVVQRSCVAFVAGHFIRLRASTQATPGDKQQHCEGLRMVRFRRVLSIGQRNILFSDCVEGDVDDEAKTEDSIF